MKNQKGITLVSLMTTVILIMILASVATYSGIDSYNNMRVQAFVTKMIALQEKVDVYCDKYDVSEINEQGVTSNYEARAVLNYVIDEGNQRQIKVMDRIR